MEALDEKKVYTEFRKLVNMSAATIKRWLTTEESKEVGWDSGDGESIGHKSGKKIISLLEKKKAELTKPDFKHMQKVVGYIRRHMAQRPAGNKKESRWNYSLKNWGHDYSKA